MLDVPIASASVPGDGLCDLVVGPWTEPDALGQTAKDKQKLTVTARKKMTLRRAQADSALEPTPHGHTGYELEHGDELSTGVAFRVRLEWVPCCVSLEKPQEDTIRAVELGFGVRVAVKDYLPEVTHFVTQSAGITALKCLYAAKDTPVVGVEGFLHELANKSACPPFPAGYKEQWKRRRNESFDDWDARVYGLPEPPPRGDGSGSGDDQEYTARIEAWSKVCSKKRLATDKAVFTPLAHDGLDDPEHGTKETAGVDFGQFWAHSPLEHAWDNYWTDGYNPDHAPKAAPGSTVDGKAWLEPTRRARRSHVFSSALFVDIGSQPPHHVMSALIEAASGLYLRIDLSSEVDKPDQAFSAIELFRQERSPKRERRVVLFSHLGGEQLLSNKDSLHCALAARYGLTKTVTSAEVLRAVFEGTNQDVLPALPPSGGVAGDVPPLPAPTHPDTQNTLRPSVGHTLGTFDNLAGPSSSSNQPAQQQATATHSSSSMTAAPPVRKMARSTRFLRRNHSSSDSERGDESDDNVSSSNRRPLFSTLADSQQQHQEEAPSAAQPVVSEAGATSSTAVPPLRKMARSVRRPLRRGSSSSSESAKSDEDEEEDSDSGTKKKRTTRSDQSDESLSNQSSKRRKVDDVMPAPKSVAERKEEALKRKRELEEKHEQAEREAKKRREEHAAATAAAAVGKQATKKSNERRDAATAAIEAGKKALAARFEDSDDEGDHESKDAETLKKGNNKKKKKTSEATAAKGAAKKKAPEWEQVANDEFDALFKIKKPAAFASAGERVKFGAEPLDDDELYWRRVIEDAENDDPDKWMPRAEGQFVVRYFKPAGVKRTVKLYGSAQHPEADRINGRPNFKTFKRKNFNKHPRLALRGPPLVDFGLEGEGDDGRTDVGKAPRMKVVDAEEESDAEDDHYRIRALSGKQKKAKETVSRAKTGKGGGASQLKITAQRRARSTRSVSTAVIDSEDEVDTRSRSRSVQAGEDDDDDEGRHSSHTLEGEPMSDIEEESTTSTRKKKTSGSRNKAGSSTSTSVATSTKAKGKAATTTSTKRKNEASERAAAAGPRAKKPRMAQTTLLDPDSDSDDGRDGRGESSGGGVKFRGLTKSTQAVPSTRAVRRSR